MIKPQRFSEDLMKWYASQEQRPMPWLREKNAYKIWVSEIMLQQTTVTQVKPYYEQFLSRFPTIQSLAEATEDEVLHYWQGLGYNSRARYLLASARQVMEEYDGHFPRNYDEIISLKGIGDYTAAAISAFAYEEPYYVIDTNVKRLYARLFDVDHPIESKKDKAEITDFLMDAGATHTPSDFNQALLNFGATICMDKKPLCSDCIYNESCIGLAKGVQAERPVKKKKKPRRKRYFHYFVFHDETSVAIQKRSGKDIWQGMYEFMLYENKSTIPLEWKRIQSLFPDLNLPTKIGSQVTSYEYVQVLTHQKIHAVTYHIPMIPSGINASIVTLEEIADYAFPGILRKHIASEDFLLP